MGYIFETEGNQLWSPGNTVATLFMAQLACLEKMVEVESGVREVMPNMVGIDSLKLRTFMAATSRYISKSNNTSLRTLSRAVIVHLIALCLRHERICPMEVLRSYDPAWFHEAEQLAAQDMPK